jgi:hypothetical protein
MVLQALSLLPLYMFVPSSVNVELLVRRRNILRPVSRRLC